MRCNRRDCPENVVMHQSPPVFDKKRDVYLCSLEGGECVMRNKKRRW